jgi:hypothetical protein
LEEKGASAEEEQPVCKALLRAIRAQDTARAVAILEYHLQKQYNWIIDSFADGNAPEVEVT